MLFSPENDYYITSMNWDQNLLKEFGAHDDILDDIKKLSDLGHSLLENGPGYQNDIDKMFLFVGVQGTIIQKLDYHFWLSNAQINNFLYKFQFYNIKEKKVKDCSIYSPYRHFSERGLKFKLLDNVYTVGLGEFSDTIYQCYDYKRYSFNFDYTMKQKINCVSTR